MGKRWNARQKTANGKPYWNREGQELTITQGEDKLVLSNVLVGEVWVASGQSNMLWRLNQTGDCNSLQEAETPLFRFYQGRKVSPFNFNIASVKK